MNNTDHYTPQYPLPEEIQKLDRNDTVCQFCGVSYLIHNEIKKLEEKLAEYVKEIEHLKHFDEREKILKNELSSSQINVEQLEKQLLVEKQRYFEKCQEVDTKDSQIVELQESTASKGNELKELKKEIIELQSQKESICFQLSRVSSSQKAIRAEWNNIKSSTQNLQSNYIKLIRELKAKVLDAAKSYIHQSSLQKSEDNIIKMREEIATVKDESSMEIVHCKKRQEEIIQTISTKHVSEIKEYEEEEQRLLKEIQSLKEIHSTLREESLSEKQIMQSEIIVLKTNLQTSQENTDSDKKSLLNSIQACKEEINSLKDEKLRMVDAHQYRIEELRESFLQKMKDAEKWPELLESELSKQQLRFNEEKSNLWKELTDSYEKVAEVKEVEFNEKLKKVKEQGKEIETKLKSQMEKLQVNCEDKVRRLHTNLENVNREKEECITSLEKSISVLQNKLKIQKEHDNQVSYDSALKYQLQIEDLQRLLQDQTVNRSKEKEIIEKYENELQLLRDCVRQECEERYELTESLADARMELLSLQRCYGNNNSKMKPIHIPSPPVFDHKTSSPMTNSSDEEVRQRTSSMSVKSTALSDSKLKTAGITSSIKNTSKHSSDQSRDRINTAMGRFTKTKLRLSLNKNS